MSEPTFDEVINYLRSSGLVATAHQLEYQFKPKYNLELNAEEVSVLRFILSNVGGPPAGPRGHASSVLDKLYNLNADYKDYDLEPKRGSIYFA